jgi:hypothetical protein
MSSSQLYSKQKGPNQKNLEELPLGKEKQFSSTKEEGQIAHILKIYVRAPQRF